MNLFNGEFNPFRKGWQRLDTERLIAYNITIRLQSPDTFFFKHKPTTIPNAIDPAFLTAPIPPQDDLSDGTHRLLQYLDLATHAPPGQESATHDFARELLRALGFEERGTVLRARHTIPLTICGDAARSARADLCLVQGRTAVLMLVDSGGTGASARDAEAQLVAQAVAAFQHNNAVRDRIGVEPLYYMILPAIVMIGTRSVFYKIPVSQDLSDAIAAAEHPALKTEVDKCVVAPTSRRLSEGMEVPEFRREILRHYDAFRKMSKEFWEHFVV